MKARHWGVFLAAAFVLFAFSTSAWAATAQVKVTISDGGTFSTGQGAILELAIDAAITAQPTLTLGSITTFRVESVPPVAGETAYELTSADFIYIKARLTAIEELIFDIGVQSDILPASAFAGITSLETVSLPRGTTTISASAFEGCTTLEMLSSTEWVTTIGNDAFKGCGILASTVAGGLLNFPLLTTIGAGAFEDCTGITQFCAPSLGNAAGDSIGAGAFDGCIALTHLLLGADLPATTASVFDGNGLNVYARAFTGNLDHYGTGATGNLYSIPARPASSPEPSLTPTSLSFAAGGQGRDVTATSTQSSFLPKWNITGGAATFSPTPDQIFISIVTVTPGNSPGSGLIRCFEFPSVTIDGINVVWPFFVSIPYTVTSGGDGDPVVTDTLSITDDQGKTWATTLTQGTYLVDFTWQQSLPTTLDSVVNAAFGGVKYSAFNIKLPSGIPTKVELWNDGRTKSIIKTVGAQYPVLTKIIPGTTGTLYRANSALQKLGITKEARLVDREFIFTDSLFGVSPYFTKYPTLWNSHLEYFRKYGDRFLGYIEIFEPEKPQISAADPLVLGAGITFQIAVTGTGTQITPPANLAAVLKDYWLNKVFGATSVFDLFEVLTPYVEQEVVSYSITSFLPPTGTLTVNSAITIVDGPAPKDNTNVLIPVPGEPYGLYYDAENNVLVIYDGVQDGVLIDPIVLMKKTAVVPTAISLTPTPSPLTLKKGGSGTIKAAFTPADATERDLVWSVSVPAVASVTKASAEDTWTVRGLFEGMATLTATASADGTVKATMAVTVMPAESDLFKAFAMSPEPPYRRGTEVEILASLNRAASSVKAAVERPDGNTDTPTVNVEGTEAWVAYTLEALGSYTVTVEAVDATTGTTWTKTATLTVTESGATGGSSSSGGCNAGMGISVLALGVLLKRKQDNSEQSVSPNE